MENCDSLLFLGGKGVETVKNISEMLGKETLDVEAKNRTKGFKSSSTSESNSILGRELMFPNELVTIDISKCVLIIKAHNPFFCTKYPIENHPNYKFLEDFDKKNKFDYSSIKVITLEKFVLENQEKINSTAENNEISESEQERLTKVLQTAFEQNELEQITSNIFYSEYELESYEDAEIFNNENIQDYDYGEEIFSQSNQKFGTSLSLEYYDFDEFISNENSKEQTVFIENSEEMEVKNNAEIPLGNTLDEEEQQEQELEEIEPENEYDNDDSDDDDVEINTSECFSEVFSKPEYTEVNQDLSEEIKSSSETQKINSAFVQTKNDVDNMFDADFDF
jgi:type IV secretion system protein VirD4